MHSVTLSDSMQLPLFAKVAFTLSTEETSIKNIISNKRIDIKIKYCYTKDKLYVQLNIWTTE